MRITHFVYEELTEAYARYAAEVPGFIPRLGRIFGKEAT
jgi:protein-S-isoprenylcysteine O-methyltransferase Ste14